MRTGSTGVSDFAVKHVKRLPDGLGNKKRQRVTPKRAKGVEMAKHHRRARGEGSVCFKPAKNCWVWRAVSGFKPDGRVRYVEGRARTQAEAVKRKRVAERTGRQADAAKLTVCDYLDRWLTETKPNVRPATWASYERVVRLHLAPNVGGIPFGQFAAADVNRLYGKLARNDVSSGN